MTRLDAMRALLALPIADDHQRVSRAIQGYETADAAKLRAVKITTRRKPPRKTKASSRIGWLHSVHERGA